MKNKVNYSADLVEDESEDILLNLKEQSADLSDRFKKSADDLKKPVNKMGEVAKDTTEDILI